jgi:crossover junction endodeoxyribonuclease RuvC
MTIILGVDPGSRFTGYGVIHVEKKKAHFLTCGVIKVKENPLALKLQQIFEELSQCIQTFKPDEAVYEMLFMHKNAQSALKLGHARGAAMVAASIKGVSLFEYTAKQIKQSVVGHGGAGKAQVQHMVKCLLNLGRAPEEDAADALAAALCHAHLRESPLHLAKERLKTT